MRFSSINPNLLKGLCLTPLFATYGQAQSLQDGCPKDELTCHDIMNASQCIEQIIVEGLSPVTREGLVKCVEHEGTASNLPGAVKYCRCPGCHTAQINAVIAEMFPPPCA
ncbi:hypothetical protein N656DRAFT_832064 [Canariomyces notabilis]|uniref:Uncharacterized protein n=1 Tax=Canariomyces notabilis TaxID=2074819 RepID=A0AAN6QFU7_9PEZI|nr:hypothetical protein N656DRAFT_832064 [Canariomyces arenarius]